MEAADHRFVTIRCSHCGHPIQVQLNCGDRTCPTCRRKWFGHHFRPLVNYMKSWKESYFMTLTARNIQDYELSKEYVREMRVAFGKLRKRFAGRIEGGFYVVQATNRGRGWHVHLHVIYEGKFISVRAVSKAWQEITGNRIVDVRKVGNVAAACRYMLGDFLQAPRIRPEDKELYNIIFSGSRLVQPFGKHRRVKFGGKIQCPICGRTQWVTNIDRFLLSCICIEEYNSRGDP